MTTFIYSRVSTDKQEAGKQTATLLREFPQATVVEEVMSGAKEKPGLDALLARMTAGDTLVVSGIDRLGRNAGELIRTLDSLNARGIVLVSRREGIDYRTPVGRFVAQVLAAVAEMERSMIRERIVLALAQRRAMGVRLGRPATYGEKEKGQIRELRKKGLSVRKIADLFRMDKSTVMKLSAQ